jgi:DNA adenine methylase
LLFRYPGGKRKIRDKIIHRILAYYDTKGYDTELRIPFFGAGGIEFSLLQAESRIRRIWINDYDVAIGCVWTAVLKFHNELCNAVTDFAPSTDSFYRFKNEMLNLKRNGHDIVDIALKKIALHQMSYSGLGPLSGSPLGGKGQKSIYPVDCRWNVETLRKNIKKTHNLLISRKLRGNKCESKDFMKLIKKDGNAFFYLDPPYFEKGPELYQYSFTMKDHHRLATALKETSNDWLLSYDDSGEIKRMYNWAASIKIPVICTINGAKSKNELLIASREELLHDPHSPIDMFE